MIESKQAQIQTPFPFVLFPIRLLWILNLLNFSWNYNFNLRMNCLNLPFYRSLNSVEIAKKVDSLLVTILELEILKSELNVKWQ